MSQAKMNELCDSEGLDMDGLDQLAMDSVSPGICMTEGCGYTTTVEPDCNDGWCEECETQTVKSAVELVMEGFLPGEENYEH